MVAITVIMQVGRAFWKFYLTWFPGSLGSSVMNISLTALIVAAGVVAIFAVGCTSNKPFRTNFPPSDPAHAVIESTPNYKLGFVEFDDQGWFWDTNQANLVKQMIRTEAGIGRPNNQQGIVIVVFVHGWKNNAASTDTNVNTFRTVLAYLDSAEKAQTKHAPRKIVGVYGGWRGLSAKWEPAKELSFWERKNTAHKVGNSGALTELLVDLENLQEESNHEWLATNAPRTELIIVGHSFGAAAVYSAISDVVTERFVDTVPRNKALKPMGDQVILLSPAFEASRHYNLNQMAVSMRHYPVDQRPVLSIFTSEGDWATHYFFPLGRFFSTVFEKNRDAKQRRANRQAIGWFQPFITHDLVYNTDAAALASSGHSTFNPATRKHELHAADSAKLRESIANIEVQKKKWHPNGGLAVKYSFDDAILEPKPDFKPGDPILIVSVDTKIMKDHDDIGNKVLINFLMQYILFCQTDAQQHSQ
jgi:hypothetical protein